MAVLAPNPDQPPEVPRKRAPATPAQVAAGIAVLVVLFAAVLLAATVVVWWWRTVIG